jgi:uncharacterized membrane protein
MAMTRTILAFIRTTIVGGVMLLLPILLALFVLQHGLKLAVKLSAPAARMLPDSMFGGVAAGTAAAIFMLFSFAFIFGLFARTGVGQRVFSWLENSIIGSLPQFNFARGIADTVEGSDQGSIEVVLLPTDAGMTIGLMFERQAGPWFTVFIPSAPQWTTGSVVYAKSSDIVPLDISFAKAIRIQRKLGGGSESVLKSLEVWSGANSRTDTAR